jgi:pimeloyl-ACP methyl ester carboxylesterase
MADVSLNIAKQGVFSAGGTTQQAPGTFDPVDGQMAPEGQIRHSDHANVFYQIPVDGNGRSLLFLHGYGQSRTGWMGTPDGRPGFSDLFLRKGYGVYLVDQPRRASAGQSSVPVTISATPDDLNWFTQFRMGLWPEFTDNVQFPRDEKSVDQFFRQMTPDTGEFDVEVITSALVAALAESGPASLVTHSQGGIPGWFTAIASENVESVIAIEPGTFVFPEGEVPDVIPTKYAIPVQGIGVPLAHFDKLTRKPIAIYFGDNIPSEPSKVPAWDFWRGTLELAHRFAAVVNAHGGDAKVFHLPEEGVNGNDHFMFQDLNNGDVVDHMASWMATKGLT